MSLIIEPGDIAGIQGAGWLSDSIRRMTGGHPEDPNDKSWSHVGLFTTPTEVTEALNTVVVTPLAERIASARHMWVMKPPLRPEQRIAAVEAMRALVGQHYNYADIILQGFDALSGSRWFTEHFVDYKKFGPICSMAVALAEPWDGLIAAEATPNDFLGLGWVERCPLEQLK